MFTVYTLKLEGGKYYVGRTKNLSRRIEEHANNAGSQWTKKYQMERVLEVFENCDEYDENKYTFKYMNKFGIDNVRGGAFCQIVISDEEKRVINKILISCPDKCVYCGLDHLSSLCDHRPVNL